MRSTTWIGLLAGIGLTTLWASWTIITRLGLETELQIVDLYALRLLVGSLLVAPFILAGRAWRQLSWRQYAVLGGLGGLPHTLLAYAALERTTVAHFSVFQYGMTPLLTAIAGYLLIGKTIARHQISGALIILAGISALSLDALSSGGSDALWLGNSLAILSVALFGGYLVYAERWQITLSQSLMACTVLTGLIYLPLWLVWRGDAMLQVSPTELLIQGGFQGIVPGILSFYIMTLATRHIGADRTALFFAIIPLAAAALAVVLLNEPLTGQILTGLLLTALGITIASSRTPWLKPHHRARL